MFEYIDAATEELEKGHGVTAKQLVYTVHNLLLARQKELKKDFELASLYHRLATNNFYLAVAVNPALVVHLPEEQRLGFHPDDSPQEKFISYWSRNTYNQ